MGGSGTGRSPRKSGYFDRLLIPDFDAREDLIDTVIAAKPDIIGHNVETVARLTPQVRSRAVTRSASKLCRISRGRAAEPKAA